MWGVRPPFSDIAATASAGVLARSKHFLAARERAGRLWDRSWAILRSYLTAFLILFRLPP